MAGVTNTALRRLLPAGRAWALTGQADQAVEGLGDTLKHPRDFLHSVTDEARPETATETIENWLELLGIEVSASASLAEKRASAASALASIGGQSLDYINERLQAVFPDLYVEELDISESNTAGVGEVGSAEVGLGAAFTFYYYVRGTYPYLRDRARIFGILAKTAPLHLVPVFEAKPTIDSDIARAGIARAGLAVTRRTQ